jgi:hypothetical protein
MYAYLQGAQDSEAKRLIHSYDFPPLAARGHMHVTRGNIQGGLVCVD